MATHDYGLDWLDQDGLYEVTKKRFGPITRPYTAPPDPFVMVVQASIAGTSLDAAKEFELSRQINKTISNRVGNWHQDVLGLGKNFETVPHAGVIDVQSVGSYRHPVFAKEVIVEVKNRYNTIKASDEKNLWDSLENLARSQGKIAYVFQIVPKNSERFDQPWKVSGRETREHVRHCDGNTAYTMVFGRENALYEVYSALPRILDDIRESRSDFDGEELRRLFSASFEIEETRTKHW